MDTRRDAQHSRVFDGLSDDARQACLARSQANRSVEWPRCKARRIQSARSPLTRVREMTTHPLADIAST